MTGAWSWVFPVQVTQMMSQSQGRVGPGYGGSWGLLYLSKWPLWHCSVSHVCLSLSVVMLSTPWTCHWHPSSAMCEALLQFEQLSLPPIWRLWCHWHNHYSTLNNQSVRNTGQKGTITIMQVCILWPRTMNPVLMSLPHSTSDSGSVLLNALYLVDFIFWFIHF
jgi:hypothetical protein